MSGMQVFNFTVRKFKVQSTLHLTVKGTFLRKTVRSLASFIYLKSYSSDFIQKEGWIAGSQPTEKSAYLI